MAIAVENITKEYGSQRALDRISFTVEAAEVVGFLGPNGAGKSTLMKILTCFIPQTSGKAWVCGLDVQEESLEVRKKIGYLPEHNPLYLDMYVKEYLAFVAGLYGLKNTKQRIQEMIERVGLGLEQNKKIGALSKGYRQRVGLAQALIHDPQVLILDEPTSGLDPNQLVEIRELIRQSGREKTVLLSTHIMQEVEAICSRAIIIHRGNIVANSPVRELKHLTGNRQLIAVEFGAATTKEQLMEIKGVSDAKHIRENVWELSADSEHDIRKAIFEFGVHNNIPVIGLSRSEQKLEDIFRELTVKAQQP